jgi:hypothetical protein
MAMVGTILLSGGQVTTVDESDYEWLSSYRWSIAGTPKQGKSYAATSIIRDGRRQTTYMHRLILNAPHGVEVDHIDGDSLNNIRANLRLVTTAQQRQNITFRRSTTGVRGVTWSKQKGKYQVRVKVNGHTYHGGFYDALEEAAKAAVVARKRYMTHAHDPNVELPQHSFGLAHHRLEWERRRTHLYSGDMTLCGHAVVADRQWSVSAGSVTTSALEAVNCRQCKRILARRPWLLSEQN